KFSQPLEYGCKRSAGLPGAHHVDIQIAEVGRMRRQAVGQRLATLEHAEYIQDHPAELRPLGQLAGDTQCAVERHACVEQRGKLLREEENIAMASTSEVGQLQLKRFLPLDPDIDRGQPLLS